MEWTFKNDVFLKLLNMLLLLQISKASDLQPFPDIAFQSPWLEWSKLRKKKKTKTKSRAFIPLPDVADGQAVGSSCLSPVWWCSWNVCWTHTGDSAQTEPPACHMMLEGWSSATGTKRKKQTLKNQLAMNQLRLKEAGFVGQRLWYLYRAVQVSWKTVFN